MSVDRHTTTHNVSIVSRRAQQTKGNTAERVIAENVHFFCPRFAPLTSVTFLAWDVVVATSPGCRQMPRESRNQVNNKADLSTLIAPVKDRMIATVWRILRHAQDAEDALQNALVTVWRRRTEVEAHPAPQAMILRICAAAAIDQFRRRRKDQVNLEAFEDRLSSPDSPALDDLIQQERLDLVMVAISRLSANQSTAILMKYVLAESHADIAAALGCTTETVREHLARGRERLRQMLTSLQPDRSPTSASTPATKENAR